MSGQTIGAVVCAVLFVPLIACYLMVCAYFLRAIYKDMFK